MFHDVFNDQPFGGIRIQHALNQSLSVAGDIQVWSLTQIYSDSFLHSRLIHCKSVGFFYKHTIAHHESKTERRELLEGRKEKNICPHEGSLNCAPGKSIGLYKNQIRIKLSQ